MIGEKVVQDSIYQPSLGELLRLQKKKTYKKKPRPMVQDCDIESMADSPG